MSRDNRVRVPGTAIKMKHHRAMCAIARYLADGKMATTQEILDHAKMRNGKAVITRLKSKQQLANLLRVHPHFDNIKMKGYYPSHRVLRGSQVSGSKEMAHWFLHEKDSYLLGEGQAYPKEFYHQNTGQNTKGQKIKRDDVQ